MCCALQMTAPVMGKLMMAIPVLPMTQKQAYGMIAMQNPFAGNMHYGEMISKGEAVRKNITCRQVAELIFYWSPSIAKCLHL